MCSGGLLCVVCAQSMAHLPPGAGENTNYEVLEVYTTAAADRKAFLSAAAARHG